MELEYKTTPAEYMKFNGKATWKRHLKVSLIGAAAFLAIMLVVLRDYLYFAFIIVLGVAIVYFGLIFLLLRIKIRILVRKSIKKFGIDYFNFSKKIILQDDALEIKSSIRDLRIPYCGVQIVSEDHEFISIKFKAGDMVYIPIRGILNPEITEDFLSTLKSRLI